MGRPKKPTNAKRGAPVAVKFTDDERAKLAAEVERLGLPSLSDLIRQRALSGRVVVRQAVEMAAPDRIELNRLGVNLHQLVKHLNYAGAGSLPALAEIYNDARATLDAINVLLMKGSGEDAA